MYNFNIYELQRVDSEILSKRAHRAYSRLPQQEDNLFERVLATLRLLYSKQPEPVLVPVKAHRTTHRR